MLDITISSGKGQNKVQNDKYTIKWGIYRHGRKYVISHNAQDPGGRVQSLAIIPAWLRNFFFGFAKPQFPPLQKEDHIYLLKLLWSLSGPIYEIPSQYQAQYKSQFWSR